MHMKAIKRSATLILTFSLLSACYSQNSYYSRLENDTLTIGNALIERKFVWNKGNLITYSLTDKTSGQHWLNKTKSPDFRISEKRDSIWNSSYTTRQVEETTIHLACLETIISFSLGGLDIKRIYRIYNNSPAIPCHTYL